ncbi:MAG: hypothetical protein LC800_21245, partial [Acidobacteria bacterium]|nr:hypothetical protein [Acidobacteriota bacterium]
MKTQPPLSPPPDKIFGLLALLIAAAAVSVAQPPASAPPQGVETAGTETEITLRWEARPRVRRYRVQVASDPRFTDIVFDGAAAGLEHKVTGRAPGKYYWRVRDAMREMDRFSRVEPVEVPAAGTNVAGVKPKPRPTAAPRPAAARLPAATPATVATVAAGRRPPRGVGWQ